jgi:3-oxoacyl-[acyl-carrier-protein] synthase-3
MGFTIEHISYALGERAISIRNEFPGFVKVIEKTGIETVHETSRSALDLATDALENLLQAKPELRLKIRCLILVTQSPDDFLPSGACVLQDRAGLPSKILAFDIGQGCSGFVQALSVASKLTSEFSDIVIVCADTYRSKLSKEDRSTATVFSDAASATWISHTPRLEIAAESHSTDGSGRPHLVQKVGLDFQDTRLFMSGANVLLFTRRVVPAEIERVLLDAGIQLSEISNCFLHQASKLVLDGLSTRLIGAKSIPSNILNIGNTVSSSIPILMSGYLSEVNSTVSLLSGFGVGLSTATMILRPTSDPH